MVTFQLGLAGRIEVCLTAAESLLLFLLQTVFHCVRTISTASDKVGTPELILCHKGKRDYIVSCMKVIQRVVWILDIAGFRL